MLQPGGPLSFPNPVNEKAARTVAAGVAVLGLIALFAEQPWLSAVLAAGFLLRVAAGPRFSPLGLLATRVVAPRLRPPKLVAGPPKRFAQAMGALFSVSATVVYFGFGLTAVAYGLLAALVVAAVLESVFALCIGCQAFRLLMRLGVIPAEVCAACADLRGPAALALRQAATQQPGD